MRKILIATLLLVMAAGTAIAGYVMNPYTGRMDNTGPFNSDGVSVSIDKNIYCSTDGGCDLGSAAKSFGDAWIDGTVYAGGAVLSGAGYVGIGTLSPTALLTVGSTSSLASADGVNDLLVGDDLEVNGTIYGTTISLSAGGNVGIGTTTPSTLLQVGSGARSSGPTASTTDTLIKSALQVDGIIYNPGISVLAGNYVCYNTTSKLIYVNSTCP